MHDSEVPEGEGPALTTLRDHGLGSMGGDMGLTPFLQGGVTKDSELGDGELPTESSGKSSDTSAGPAFRPIPESQIHRRDQHGASPRLMPIPESPTNSESPAFPPATEDPGQTSNSFDQQCAPSHALECVNGNYDNLSYDQIRNLCKDRGYHKKDAKAALKTRLEAVDAVERQSINQKANEKDA